MIENPHIVIVGGGITGLSAAFLLERFAENGGVDMAITLLEQSDHIGGKLRSDHIDGFVVDGGADIFLASKPAAMALCETLGIADELVETNPKTRKTFVQRDNVLHPETMYANERLVTPRSGMQRLANVTAGALQRTQFRLDSSVSTVQWLDPQYGVRTSDGKFLIADAVVIAVPAGPASLILQRIAPDSAESLKTLSYSTTTTISAGFHRNDVPHSLDGYGYLVENPAPGAITACTWSSSKIAGRAPINGVLLRGYIRAGHELPAAEAHARFLEELRATLGITVDPVFIRSYVWEESLPIYPENNDERIVTLSRSLKKFPGLALAGSVLHAPGIPDSIQSAFTSAKQVWRHIDSFISSS